MRDLLFLLALTLLISCKQKKPGQQAIIPDSVKKAVPKKVFVEAATNTGVSVFPADTNYPVRILLAGGTFHDGEVDPKSDSYTWQGLFKGDAGFYIAGTKLKLSRDHDAVLDEDDQKTGWIVNPDVTDTAGLLMSGFEFPNKPIDSIALTKQTILPGESVSFTYHNITYTLYATGKKGLDPDYYNISDYKLFIKAAINGQPINQLLVSISKFDDHQIAIWFAGDIDGDTIPDLIIETSYHYNLLRPTLYLSKPAQKGELLKVMGMFSSAGC